MRMLLIAAAAFAAAPALAQEADQAQPADAAAAAAPAELPVCSREVRDRCIQGPAAERMAASEFRGGGRDNSARMSPQAAARGMDRQQPQD